MRLVKLLAYSLLGYVLYELYLGMTEGVRAAVPAAKPPAASNEKGRGRRSKASAGSRKSAASEDSDGTGSNQTVGRGVVH